LIVEDGDGIFMISRTVAVSSELSWHVQVR